MSASHPTYQSCQGPNHRRRNNRGNAADSDSAPVPVSASAVDDPDMPSLIPAPLRPQGRHFQRTSPLAREFVPSAQVSPRQPAPRLVAETRAEVAAVEARSLSETQNLPDSKHATLNTTSVAMESTPQETTASMTPIPQVRLPPNQIPCRFFQAGCCTRGEKCWYRHDIERPTMPEPVAAASTPNATDAPASSDSTEVETCSICFDKPETYGLMTGCDHIFCLECIRKWRCSSSTACNGGDDPYADDPRALANTSKTCPLCRVRTRYIIPSVVFPTTALQKKHIERVYLLRLSKIPCRYFAASLQPRDPPRRDAPHGRRSNGPWCPFGNECHYQHEKVPGVPYEFSESELQRAMWGQRAAARRRAASRWGREGRGRASYGPEWVIQYVDNHHLQYESMSDFEADSINEWEAHSEVAGLLAGLLDLDGPGVGWDDITIGVEMMDELLAATLR